MKLCNLFLEEQTIKKINKYDKLSHQAYKKIFLYALALNFFPHWLAIFMS